MQELFNIIKDIAIKIDEAIKDAPQGYSDFTNKTGDVQLKLDILCDKIIEEELYKSNIIKSIISEEKEDELIINKNNEYIICYDPLDGSSIVDSNLSVGSIFGVYKNSLEASAIEASFYIVYGPRVEIVKTIRGKKPILYTYINGEFKEQKELSLKAKGKINAPGGTQKYWYEHHKNLINELFSREYRLRYSGGMVPDLHQILIKGGGLFSYPSTINKPKGKLRALFEVIPFALTYIQAGGDAIDNKLNSLLTIKPSFIHDTTPCFFGSKEEIELVKRFYSGAK